MCYSAIVEAGFKAHQRMVAAFPKLTEFESLFQARLSDPSIKVPKAVEANFDSPKSAEEEQIKSLIDRFRLQQSSEWEIELFKQRKRLVDAERSLATKETKKALSDKRIAGNKVAWLQAKLRDLKSPDLKPSDSRIFPMWYAPVVIMDGDRPVIVPMRYHCRPNGKPEFYDKKFDGLYNARRDSLGRFWKELFGRNHGIMIASSFFENVALHDFERRELRPDEKPSNVVLHFNPEHAEPMLVACLWDRWHSPGKPDLLSFAAITDEPPAEVAETGHDRCIVPLRPENVRAWLDPAKATPTELQALLDDRARPYYQHRLAA